MCSSVFQDRPRVTQDAKVEAPRLPNDNFGNNNLIYVCKKEKPRIYNLKAMSNGQGPAAEGVGHKIID